MNDSTNAANVWDVINTPTDGLATWKRIQQIKTEIGRLQYELFNLEMSYYSKQYQYNSVNYTNK